MTSCRVFRVIIALAVFSMLIAQPALVAAQPTPARVVQGSDGMLYFVQNGTAWTLMPDQITDSDLAALNVAGEIDGTLPPTRKEAGAENDDD